MNKEVFLKEIWKDICTEGAIIPRFETMIIPSDSYPNVLDYETNGRFLVNVIAFLFHIELTLYAYGTLSCTDRDPKSLHRIEKYLFKNLGI